MSRPPARRFVALVPVKSPARGKSRLTGISDDLRRELAVAFALDTLAAVCATSVVAEVVVVTGDPTVVEQAALLGCSLEGDHGDLNGSLVAAAASLAGSRPELHPVAVCADLPALRPDDLRRALRQVEPGNASYVADHTGTGTTLYGAPYSAFVPQFGPCSRAAHRAAGAIEIVGELTRLRRDVDSMADLDALARTGCLGDRTRAVLSLVGR